MIHVAAVRHFMRHQPAEKVRRRQDDPPVVADCAACRAASPAARRVADRDGSDRDARPLRGIGRGFAKPAASHIPKEALDPAGKGIFRPAAAEFSVCKSRCARLRWVPVQSDCPSLDRDGCARMERLCRIDCRQLGLDPIGLLAGPFEGRPPAHPPGIAEQQQAAAFVNPKPDRARSGMGAEFDRPGEAGQAQQFRAACRQGAIPGRQRRFR